jgi:hypothetical protein
MPAPPTADTRLLPRPELGCSAGAAHRAVKRPRVCDASALGAWKRAVQEFRDYIEESDRTMRECVHKLETVRQQAQGQHVRFLQQVTVPVYSALRDGECKDEIETRYLTEVACTVMCQCILETTPGLTECEPTTAAAHGSRASAYILAMTMYVLDLSRAHDKRALWGMLDYTTFSRVQVADVAGQPSYQRTAIGAERPRPVISRIDAEFPPLPTRYESWRRLQFFPPLDVALALVRTRGSLYQAFDLLHGGTALRGTVVSAMRESPAFAALRNETHFPSSVTTPVTDLTSRLRVRQCGFLREHILAEWVTTTGGRVTADLVQIVLTGLRTYPDRARVVSAYPAAMDANVFLLMIQADDASTHADDIRKFVRTAAPGVMAPILNNRRVHDALMRVIRAPWWIKGTHDTLEGSLCAACQMELLEHVPVKNALQRYIPRYPCDVCAKVAGPKFYANKVWVVKVLYVGNATEPAAMPSDDAHRAAAASIEACVTDFVLNKMDWAGRSFGLIVGSRSYVCIMRPHLYNVNSLSPVRCGRFFRKFGEDSGISHINPHAGNVGVTADGVHVAFDFKRAALIDASRPNAGEDELIAYARAVREDDTTESARLFDILRFRSGLQDLMSHFTRIWTQPVNGYAAAFTRDMLSARE